MYHHMIVDFTLLPDFIFIQTLLLDYRVLVSVFKN